MYFMFHGLVMFMEGIYSFSKLTRSFEARQTIRSVWWISFAMCNDEHVIEPPRDNSRGKPPGVIK